MVNTHRDSNIFSEYHISESKTTILITSIRLFFVKYLLPLFLEDHYIEVAENHILERTFGLRTKCIIPERALTN